MFFISDERSIKDGKTTDIYFSRTEDILRKKKLNPAVAVEIFLRGFPDGYEWGILSGVEECIKLLEGIPGIDLYSMPEGTVFKAEQPVMSIRGKYLDFGRFETPILGFLCHCSGISTKAARCRIAAGQKTVFNFGARRIHPGITPAVERSAYIGGLDGVSTIAGAEAVGMEPVGTMPHALIIIMGDTLEALKSFDEVIDRDVKRIALIDTFNDEKFEAIRISEADGENLYGIRLDTPGSRRGDFKKIIEEIRWELEIRGLDDLKIMVSGGLDEEDIINLGDVVDAFGIGTAISGARVLDFSLDIVEVDSKWIAKRGKMSGQKKVIRCSNCMEDMVVLDIKNAGDYTCKKCGCIFKDLFVNVLKNGKQTEELPSVQEIKGRVLEQLEFLEI
jgi:nicotinate phosphoribosyltransferase